MLLVDLLTVANMTFLNTSHLTLPAGATYRPAYQFGMSCQFYKPPQLNYINASFNEFVIGVSPHLFRRSRACHQCLLVNGELAIIGDLCPTCTPYQLDLNPFLSRRLNGGEKPRNYDFRELQIKRVDCAFAKNKERLFFDEGSSRNVLYMIPLYLKRPLVSLRISDGTVGTHDTFGRWVTIHRLSLDCRKNYVATGCYAENDCFEQEFNCTSFVRDRLPASE